jgi:hypothetical protein
MRMSIRQMCAVRIQSVARGMLVRKRMQRLRKRLQPLRRRIALARLASTPAAVQEEEEQASRNTPATAATEQQQASSSRPRELARRGGAGGGERGRAGGDAGRRCMQQLLVPQLPRWVARPPQGGAAGRQWVEVVEALRREVRAPDTVT